MPKVTVHVLAEDFKNNKYSNAKHNMEGCPIQRAMMRAGLTKKGQNYHECQNYENPIFPEGEERVYMNGGHPVDQTVIKMFNGKIPIEDFSFDIEVG